ncbi:MAG: RelA/SpoT family protein [Flavobacteriales bacterium]
MHSKLKDSKYTEAHLEAIQLAYEDLLQSIDRPLNDREQLLLKNAYEMALVAHRKQMRKSGEPYIFHPIAVAKIVAEEIGLGPTSIAAALIHDVVEDSDEHSLIDVELMFGKSITSIINGLTKIPKTEGRDVSNQAKNIRKIMLTLIDDPRVVFVKLADRLHNMRTMDAQKPASQKRIAAITQYVFIPLAHRIGLYAIKSELEDLCLKYTAAEAYQNIKAKLKAKKIDRENYINQFIESLKPRINAEGLVYEIKGRPKSIYSIHQKMLRQEVDFEEVFDKLAVRIVIDMEKSFEGEAIMAKEKVVCYTVLSIITDLYKPNPKRYRDLLVSPKSNGYQSLHATVKGPEKKWVEVQVRTKRMDVIAEKGLASHWSYKEIQQNNKDTSKKSLNVWYERIREVLEHAEDNELEFLNNIKLSLYNKEIAVYTPGGDVILLPKGSSVLDFAFEIHSDLGSKCTGGKINGKLKAFSTVLKNGDEVEILTTKRQMPKENWLNYVVTTKAKNKIRDALNLEKNRIAEHGKEILHRKLKAIKIDFTDKNIQSLQHYFKVRTSQDLFYKIGSNEIDSKALRKYREHKSSFFKTYFKNPFKTNKEHQPIEPKLFAKPVLRFGKNKIDLDYSFAKCCTPIPGDEVFAYAHAEKNLKVHKHSCTNAQNMLSRYAHRIMEAEWIESDFEAFEATLELVGVDSTGILVELSDKLTKQKKVDIRRINIEGEHGVFRGELSLVVKSKNQLDELINTLQDSKGVSKVTRKI